MSPIRKGSKARIGSSSRSAKKPPPSLKSATRSASKEKAKDRAADVRTLPKTAAKKPSKKASTKTGAAYSPKPQERKTKPRQNVPLVSTVALPPTKNFFDPADILDAPEFHEEARAMGILTTGTWDEDRRSFEDRRADFLFAHPPADPTRNIGGRLQRQDDRSFAPGDQRARLERFLAPTWNLGSIHEVLSRFGLRMKSAPPYEGHLVRLDPLRDVAKRRNVRLRVLHGGVDVEPANMDAAKAEFLDRQEKEQAARDIRQARQRMALKRDNESP